MKDILIGQGVMFMQEDRTFQGHFSGFGLPDNGFMRNKFT